MKRENSAGDFEEFNNMKFKIHSPQKFGNDELNTYYNNGHQ